MAEMILVYGRDGCQEYFLPEEKGPYILRLGRQVSGGERESAVVMEGKPMSRFFSPGKTYRLSMEDGSDGEGRALEDGTLLMLASAEGWTVYLLYALCRKDFFLSRKYRPGRDGVITVGAHGSCAVVYQYRGYVDARQATLYESGGRWRIRTEGKGAVWLNGTRLRGDRDLAYGDRITIFGLCAVWLGECWALMERFGDLTSAMDDGQKVTWEQEEASGQGEAEAAPPRPRFKRIPRKTMILYTEPVEIEGPPGIQRASPRPLLLTVGPSLTMAVPMLLGCVMSLYGSGSRLYLVSGLTTAVASALVGALWAAAGLRYASREALEKEEHLCSAYGGYLDRIEIFLQEKQEANRRALLYEYPSGRECSRMDTSDGRFWNRGEEREGFLRVRAGVGTIPFQAKIQLSRRSDVWEPDDLGGRAAGIQEHYGWLRGCPVCLDLREKRVIGIVGGERKEGAYGIARSLAAQILANHCYTQVRMAFFYEEGPETSRIWSFARWLPHVWTEDGRMRMVAGNKKQAGEVSGCLTAGFRKYADGSGRNAEPAPPHYVIFVDCPELLEGELLEAYLLRAEKAPGLTFVLLTERYEELPNTCRYVIRRDHGGEEVLDMDGGEVWTDLSLETVEEGEMERMARRLCGIRVDDGVNGRAVPERLGFLDMYGANTLEQLKIPERWGKSRSEETLRVPVGLCAGGRLCCVDLHETYHGPHGLVAGMTGSGKSELLQTFILSLAVNYSPEDMAFFLIDFKGGGMANLFTGLPHMAGQITNLSGNRIRRALLSIKSENLRRQRILAQWGVNNINQYIRMYKEGRTEEPLPHLVIVVDEFAELKKEEPDFMTELISVAQVGRSLGIHLILATQKPSGTVDERIWSNARFRLCLRVQDVQDSKDMLRRPDAAFILQTGRGYFQVGNGEIYEEFQTAYSGAGYAEREKRREAGAVMLEPSGSVTGSGRPEGRECDTAETQLKALIRWISGLAGEQRCRKVRALWLPPLPERLSFSAVFRKAGIPQGFPRGAGDGKIRQDQGECILTAWTGIYDDPANQAQEAYGIVFPEAGHLAVCGMAGSGKSTFLTALLFALLLQYTPETLQFYGLDYGGGMLGTLERAPHCGGIVWDTDGEKADRFFHMLERILDERKSARRGTAGRKTQEGRARPLILVALDHMAGFLEKTEGKYEETLLRLCREGEACGILLAVTGYGFGNGGISHGLGQLLRTVICLAMGDRYQYMEALRATRLPVTPEEGVRGRGIACVNGRILEFQTALPEDSEETEAVCLRMDVAWKGIRPQKIPDIPGTPTLEDLWEREECKRLLAGDRYLPYGYEQRDASVCAVDLKKTFCWMIQGSDGSGKRNMLRILMRAAARKKGACLCLIDLEESGLAEEAGRLGAACLQDPVRMHGYFPVDMDEGKVHYLFLADLASFIHAAEHPPEGMGSIRPYLEKSAGFYMFCLLRPEDHSRLAGSRIFQYLASCGTGIHLGGCAGDQRLFRFPDLSYTEQFRPEPVGVGIIPPEGRDSATKKIVLPLAGRMGEEVSDDIGGGDGAGFERIV